MSHAVKIVVPEQDEDRQDSALAGLFAQGLSSFFCTDIGESGVNAFHYLFASDLDRYFRLCNYYQTKTDHKSSALSHEEIMRLRALLEHLEGKDLLGEVEKIGSDIYVACAQYNGNPIAIAPVMRNIRKGDIPEEKGHSVATWSYKLLIGPEVLIAQINAKVSSCRSELEITKPLLFCFMVNNSGVPMLTEVIPNFGLSSASILPEILRLNKIPLGKFLIKAYGVE